MSVEPLTAVSGAVLTLATAGISESLGGAAGSKSWYGSALANEVNNAKTKIAKIDVKSFFTFFLLLKLKLNIEITCFNGVMDDRLEEIISGFGHGKPRPAKDFPRIRCIKS